MELLHLEIDHDHDHDHDHKKSLVKQGPKLDSLNYSTVNIAFYTSSRYSYKQDKKIINLKIPKIS